MNDFESKVKELIYASDLSEREGKYIQEAILEAHREELNNAEEYAKEGWDWVEEFCQISGQKDVFQLRDYLQALTHIKEEDTDTDVGIRKE